MNRWTTKLRFWFGMVVASLAFVLGAANACAQCADWSGSFGNPGQGFDDLVLAVKRVVLPEGQRLIAAGRFTSAGGVPAVNIAKWDGTSWAPIGSWPFGGSIGCLEMFDDGTGPALYAGGGFQSAGVHGLAKWNGSQWVGIGVEFNGSVLTLKTGTYQGQPALFVGGSFTQLNDTRCESIAALTSAGWKVWGGSPALTWSRYTCYDPDRDRLVMIGSDSGTSSFETWEWDASTWKRRSVPGMPARTGGTMTFDPVHHRVLFMGGNQGGAEPARTLWAWNGSAWTALSAAPATMAAYQDLSLAYDSARDRLVVFGGTVNTTTVSGETWEFDGAVWTRLTPVASPSARSMASMGYDPVRARVVLFGGKPAVAAQSNETWEWDGSNWTLRTNVGPGDRTQSLLTFDPATASMILAGGAALDGTSPRDDVWSWDGTAWTPLAPSVASIGDPRVTALDTTRQKIVRDGAGYTRDLNAATWARFLDGGFFTSLPGNVASCNRLEWYNDGTGDRLFAGGTLFSAGGQASGGAAVLTGTHWGPAAASSPNTLWIASVASGPQAGLWAMGGFGSVPYLRRWQAGVWQPYLTSDGSAAGPNATYLFAADFGEGERLCALGSYQAEPGNNSLVGNDIVTVLDSTGWKPLAFREPSKRTYSAMAYDPVRHESVLFGGTNSVPNPPAGALGDTETFNGVTWTTHSVSGPAARFQHAMAFDGSNGVVVLVGGKDSGNAASGETWTWNGSSWTLAAASIGGEARYGHAMAYDAVRHRLVLFGGRDAAGIVSGATWEWDGSAWAQVSSTGPVPRDLHAMVYDPTRGRVVLLGGRDAGGSTLRDTWAWDGTQWTQLATSSSVTFPGASLVFNGTTQRLESYARDNSAYFSASNQWTSFNGTFGLVVADSRCLVYDTQLNTPVFFGGQDINSGGTTVYGGTRVLRPNGFRLPPLQVTNNNGFSYDTFGSGANLRYFFAGDGVYSRGVSVYGEPCAPPVFVQHPLDRVGVYNQGVSFTAAAIGTPPVGYQWLHNGVPVVDIPNIVSGAQTQTLNLGTTWNYGDAGEYRCVASSPHGQTVSNPAHFTAENVGPTGPVLLTKVYYPPQTFSDDPATPITGVSAAWLANSGRMAFTANTSQGARVAAWNQGLITTIAKVGANPVGVEPLTTFSQVTPLDLGSGDGGICFSGQLIGDLDPGYAKGLWFNDEGGTNLVARQGLAAAGTDGVFGSSFDFRCALNAGGTIAFLSSIAGGSAQPANSQGIWTWSRSAGASLKARLGTIAPGGTDRFSNFDSFELADDNSLTLLARSNNVYGIWTGLPNSLTRRALVGAPAAGLPGTPPILQLAVPITTAPGGVVYYAALINSSPSFKQALYRSTPAGETPLLVSGTQIADQPSGRSYVQFSPIAANSQGDLLFRATVACSGCSGTTAGIFLWHAIDGSVTTLFFGPDAPPPGVSQYFTSATPGTVGALTDLSQVVFSATVVNGGVSGPAVFGWTPTSGVFSILSPGLQVQIAPGQYRTVIGASIVGGNSIASGSSRSKSLNPLGQVAIQAQLSDNTSGLFRGTFGQFLTGLFNCPTFAVPLGDRSVKLGRAVVLSTEVAGAGPFTFVWRKDGQVLADGGRLSGAQTPGLTISAVNAQDAGTYEIEARNDCNSAIVSSGVLIILCPADLDDGSGNGTLDGAVTIDDLLYFLVSFEAGTDAADVDNGTGSGTPDGGVTIDDLLYFLFHFEQGC